MISVCIATFNGERYIKAQIESILSQLEQTDEIIISDDCSNDNTLSIINDINDERIKIITHKRIFIKKHHANGYYCSNNFANAINHAKGDYIFLSDQDDIWYEGKVKRVLEELQKSDLCFSNFSIIDQDQNIIDKIHFKENPITKNWFYNFNKNVFFGCCMAFKKDCIKDFMPIPITIPSYDTWIGTVLHFRKKKISFIMEPLVFYRRHNSNVSQATCKSKNSVYFKIFWRIQFLVELIKYLKKNKG